MSKGPDSSNPLYPSAKCRLKFDNLRALRRSLAFGIKADTRSRLCTLAHNLARIAVWYPEPVPISKTNISFSTARFIASKYARFLLVSFIMDKCQSGMALVETEFRFILGSMKSGSNSIAFV